MPARKNLAVHLRRPGLMGSLRGAETATWMDFHADRMSFEAARQFPKNTRLLLDLAIENYAVDALGAVVKSCRAASSGKFRYEVVFDLDDVSDADKQEIAAIERTMKSITSHLTKDSLVEKIDWKKLAEGGQEGTA